MLLRYFIRCSRQWFCTIKELKFLLDAQYVSCNIGIEDSLSFTLISGVCSSPNFNINILPQCRLPNHSINFVIHCYYVNKQTIYLFIWTLPAWWIVQINYFSICINCALVIFFDNLLTSLVNPNDVNSTLTSSAAHLTHSSFLSHCLLHLQTSYLTFNVSWREGRADTACAISQPHNFLFVFLPYTTSFPFFSLYLCPCCILLSFLVPFFLLILLHPEFFSPEYTKLGTAQSLQNFHDRNRRTKSSSCFCPLRVFSLIAVFWRLNNLVCSFYPTFHRCSLSECQMFFSLAHRLRPLTFEGTVRLRID